MHRAVGWVVVGVTASAWLAVTMSLPPMGSYVSAAWLAVPAAVTVAVSRTARATWWRWIIVWAVFLTSEVTMSPFVLTAGYSWIVWDAWATAHSTIEPVSDDDGDGTDNKRSPRNGQTHPTPATETRPGRKSPTSGKERKAPQ